MDHVLMKQNYNLYLQELIPAKIDAPYPSFSYRVVARYTCPSLSMGVGRRLN